MCYRALQSNFQWCIHCYTGARGVCRRWRDAVDAMPCFEQRRAVAWEHKLRAATDGDNHNNHNNSSSNSSNNNNNSSSNSNNSSSSNGSNSNINSSLKRPFQLPPVPLLQLGSLASHIRDHFRNRSVFMILCVVLQYQHGCQYHRYQRYLEDCKQQASAAVCTRLHCP
jgi:hypothetical protein